MTPEERVVELELKLGQASDKIEDLKSELRQFLTERDKIAIGMMCNLIGKATYRNADPHHVASRAYEYADAFLDMKRKTDGDRF